jgi:hypothetical protein
MEGEAIAALIVETKSGRRAIRAKTFIDCSGDADVAARAGVPFETGDGQGGGLFPTMMFRVGGVDSERALAAIGEFKAIDRLMSEAAGKGYRFPREGAIVRPQKNPTEWRVPFADRALVVSDRRHRAAAATRRRTPSGYMTP